MLVVSRESWHYKVYRWWYQRKYKSSEPTQSNLCPYVRAVVLWAPLRFIFSDWIGFGKVKICYLTIPIALYSIPQLCGYFSYNFKTFLWFVEVVAFVVASIAILACAISNWNDKRVRKPASGFGKLLREYSRSAHDRVCPEVIVK